MHDDTTLTLDGPDDLHIDLDRSQVFPDDPGAGTPAMVYIKGSRGWRDSGTYWCACDTGVLSGNDSVLSRAQVQWLAAQADRVESFLYGEG
jgi:hypothetical protein